MRAPPKPVLIGGGLLLAALVFIYIRRRAASSTNPNPASLPATVSSPSSDSSGLGALLAALSQPAYGSGSSTVGSTPAPPASGLGGGGDAALAAPDSSAPTDPFPVEATPTLAASTTGVLAAAPPASGLTFTPYSSSTLAALATPLPADAQQAAVVKNYDPNAPFGDASYGSYSSATIKALSTPLPADAQSTATSVDYSPNAPFAVSDVWGGGNPNLFPDTYQAPIDVTQHPQAFDPYTGAAGATGGALAS